VLLHPTLSTTDAFLAYTTLTTIHPLPN